MVEVTHAVSAPVATLVHPVGNAGAVTPSKFSAVTLSVCDKPVGKVNRTRPRSLAPSWSWNVAVIVSPQPVPAVKVNGRATLRPTGWHGTIGLRTTRSHYTTTLLQGRYQIRCVGRSSIGETEIHRHGFTWIDRAVARRAVFRSDGVSHPSSSRSRQRCKRSTRNLDQEADRYPGHRLQRCLSR